ncbi:MAG: ATPase P, partial [Chloroflexi bacterium]
MIEVNIPDFGQLALDYLVLDFNGTLAVDGRLLPTVA